MAAEAPACVLSHSPCCKTSAAERERQSSSGVQASLSLSLSLSGFKVLLKLDVSLNQCPNKRTGLIVDNNAHTYFTEIFFLLKVADGESVDENCGFSLFDNCKDLQLPAAAK
jgi:hypothetical protein